MQVEGDPESPTKTGIKYIEKPDGTAIFSRTLMPDDYTQELEFIQLLANPEYLGFLSKEGYFKDPNFRAFLTYLKYLTRAPHCLRIQYPACLRVLEILTQTDDVCDKLQNAGVRNKLYQTMFLSWIHTEELSYEHYDSLPPQPPPSSSK